MLSRSHRTNTLDPHNKAIPPPRPGNHTHPPQWQHHRQYLPHCLKSDRLLAGMPTVDVIKDRGEVHGEDNKLTK